MHGITTMVNTKIPSASNPEGLQAVRPKSRRISFLIPPKMVAQVEEVSREDALTTSELLREALQLYFSKRVPQRRPPKAGRRRYTYDELVKIADLANQDPNYAELRAEDLRWDRAASMDGLTGDDS